jgi:sRNA-binding protein
VVYDLRMDVIDCRDLTAGQAVTLDDGSTHTVATVEESAWDDHRVLTFTDGCHMYAVPCGQTFSLTEKAA